MIETPVRKYQKHRSVAKVRQIDFQLTFDEWLSIWQQSGKWHLRGRGTGTYVMSRVNDAGPYAVGNVFIQSNAQNITDAKNTGRRKGSTHSEETKRMYSKQRKGIVKPKVECIHCKKMIAVNMSKRWHFDNCKDKI
jgi:hypothetical protein